MKFVNVEVNRNLGGKKKKIFLVYQYVEEKYFSQDRLKHYVPTQVSLYFYLTPQGIFIDTLVQILVCMV